MTEKLVSYSTGLLAKEKGFNTPCGQYFDKVEEKTDKYDGEILERLENDIALQQRRDFGMYAIQVFDYNHLLDWKGEEIINENMCSAPRLTLLQQWLRESYIFFRDETTKYWNCDIWVKPFFSKEPKQYEGFYWRRGEEVNCGIFASYDIALETCIVNALNTFHSY